MPTIMQKSLWWDCQSTATQLITNEKDSIQNASTVLKKFHVPSIKEIFYIFEKYMVFSIIQDQLFKFRSNETSSGLGFFFFF